LVARTAERAFERWVERGLPAHGCGWIGGRPAPAGEPDRLAAAGRTGWPAAQRRRRALHRACVPLRPPAAAGPSRAAAGNVILQPVPDAAAGHPAVPGRRAALAALAVGAAGLPGCRRLPGGER